LCQHNEIMLQTLQLAAPGVYLPERLPVAGSARAGFMRVDVGRFTLGADASDFAYDDELHAAGLQLERFFTDSEALFGLAFASAPS
jgi:hypothetical protein